MGPKMHGNFVILPLAALVCKKVTFIWFEKGQSKETKAFVVPYHHSHRHAHSI